MPFANLSIPLIFVVSKNHWIHILLLHFCIQKGKPVERIYTFRMIAKRVVPFHVFCCHTTHYYLQLFYAVEKCMYSCSMCVERCHHQSYVLNIQRQVCRFPSLQQVST